MIVIGKVIKAQGIKGEIKLQPLSDNLERFLRLKEVFINDISFTVAKSRVNDGFVYVKLMSVDDRNSAEGLVGYDFCVKKKDAIRLPSDRYFISDLIGCELIVGDEPIGIVTEIDNFGSADVYTVVGDLTWRFPFLKDMIISVNIEKKQIILEKTRFGQVAIAETN